MIKVLITIMMLIMPCLADVSVSIHTFNNQEDLTTSVSFDSGISCIGELLDPDNINMMETGSVTGSGSSKLDYLNPFVKYSESFDSHNRDTKWMNEINNCQINSVVISSKSLFSHEKVPGVPETIGALGTTGVSGTGKTPSPTPGPSLNNASPG